MLLFMFHTLPLAATLGLHCSSLSVTPIPPVPYLPHCGDPQREALRRARLRVKLRARSWCFPTIFIIPFVSAASVDCLLDCRSLNSLIRLSSLHIFTCPQANQDTLNVSRSCFNDILVLLPLQVFPFYLSRDILFSISLLQVLNSPAMNKSVFL